MRHFFFCEFDPIFQEIDQNILIFSLFVFFLLFFFLCDVRLSHFLLSELATWLHALCEVQAAATLPSPWTSLVRHAHSRCAYTHAHTNFVMYLIGTMLRA